MTTYVQHICKIVLCSDGYASRCWSVVAWTCIGNLLYSHIKFVVTDGPYYSFKFHVHYDTKHLITWPWHYYEFRTTVHSNEMGMLSSSFLGGCWGHCRGVLLECNADSLSLPLSLSAYLSRTSYLVAVKTWHKHVTFYKTSTSSRPALGSTQPPIQWVPGALSPGIKRQGREADH
jgi:hypothetical protein